MVWHTRAEPAKGELVVMHDMDAAAHLMDAASHRAILDHAGLNVHSLAFRTEDGDFLCRGVLDQAEG